MRKNNEDENFKANIDDLVKCIEDDSKGELDKYERVKAWLINNNLEDIYKRLDEKSFPGERNQSKLGMMMVNGCNISDALEKDNNEDEVIQQFVDAGRKYASDEGSIRVMRRQLSVKETKAGRNETTYFRFENLLQEMEFGEDEYIFKDEEGYFVIRMDDCCACDELKYEYVNYERLKIVLKYWDKRIQTKKELLTYEGGIYVATELKRLIPPKYVLITDGKRQIVEKSREEIAEEGRRIDKHVMQYILNQDEEPENKIVFLEIYLGMLSKFKYPLFIMDNLRERLETLSKINKTGYLLSALNVYDRINQINETLLEDVKFFEENILNQQQEDEILKPLFDGMGFLDVSHDDEEIQ